MFASGPAFHRPTGITTNSSGHLFVANHQVGSGESHLLTITPDGEVSNYPPSTKPVSFSNPLIDLCVIKTDRRDEIYVSSHFDISYIAVGKNSSVIPIATGIDVEGLACGAKGDYAVYFTTRNFVAEGETKGSGAAVVVQWRRAGLYIGTCSGLGGGAHSPLPSGSVTVKLGAPPGARRLARFRIVAALAR